MMIIFNKILYYLYLLSFLCLLWGITLHNKKNTKAKAINSRFFCSIFLFLVVSPTTKNKHNIQNKHSLHPMQWSSFRIF